MYINFECIQMINCFSKDEVHHSKAYNRWLELPFQATGYLVCRDGWNPGIPTQVIRGRGRGLWVERTGPLTYRQITLSKDLWRVTLMTAQLEDAVLYVVASNWRAGNDGC